MRRKHSDARSSADGQRVNDRHMRTAKTFGFGAVRKHQIGARRRIEHRRAERGITRIQQRFAAFDAYGKIVHRVPHLQKPQRHVFQRYGFAVPYGDDFEVGMVQ